MNDDAKKQLVEFVNLFQKQVNRKTEENFDGMYSLLSIDKTLRLAIEELGEVATAVTRERYLQAYYESIDVANCAFLIWLAVKRKLDSEESK